MDKGRSTGLGGKMPISFHTHLRHCYHLIIFECVCVCVCESVSHVLLFATPWTMACQAPQSMGFSRQEYCSGLPFPSPEHLPDPGIKPRSPTLEADALTSEPPGKQYGRPRFNPWVWKIPWRRKWQPTPVFLPGQSHGQRSLVGYSPWGCKESDTTEQLHLTLHMSAH